MIEELKSVSPSTITAEELEHCWNGKLSERLSQKVAGLNLEYRRLTKDERDASLLRIVDVLLSPLVAAGEHRIGQWENGWDENLQKLRETGNLDAVVPRYFGKHQVVRWNGDLAQPLSSAFEYHILSFLVEWAMETWFGDVESIYEFGCGPGYHLLRARSIFPSKTLVGLDWTKASQNILSAMVEMRLVQNLRGHSFNFFAPDYGLELGNSAGVYSVAALEQIGDRHDAFIEFLLKKKPRVCVHIEPINELLDENLLLDRLSLAYTRKRNYLEGFLPRLRQLQKEGKLKIHAEQRTQTGSLFLEGHSLVVWSPV